MSSLSALKLSTTFIKQINSKNSVSVASSIVNLWQRSWGSSMRYGTTTTQQQPPPSDTDFLIIGGGIFGSSIAFWLKKRRPELRIAIIERADTMSISATVRSAAVIRQQFSIPQSVLMSLFCAEFMRTGSKDLAVEGEDQPDISLDPAGYLFLAKSQEHAKQMKTSYEMQKKLGAKVELLTKDACKQKFPFMTFDDVVLASYGLENEGIIDAALVLSAIRAKNKSMGIKYFSTPVESIETESVSSNLRRAKGCHVSFQSSKHFVTCKQLINAAGPWAGEVASKAGIGSGKLLPAIPIEPRKRYVYVFHCPHGPAMNMPMLIDHSGIWCRREGKDGQVYIVGRSPTPSEDKLVDHSNLDVDYNYFHEHIWPELAARVPVFEEIKVTSAWAGYYDFCYFDENGLIGMHPAFDNFYQVCGFSGHGLQHAWATGRGFAELVCDGRFTSIDLTIFGLERLTRNEPLNEAGII